MLDFEFFHKLNRIVVCVNLFFMRAIEIKERAPGQTPPIFQRVQNLGGRLLALGPWSAGQPCSPRLFRLPF